MADLNFYADLISNAPAGIIQLGDENHLQNMANFSTLVNASGGGDPTAPKIKDNPDQSFGNWTGDFDTKTMAKDLMKRGMIGADQIFFQTPDTSTRNGITRSRSDVIPAAISQILQNAHNLGLKSPEAILANKNVLLANPLFRDTVNNPGFAQIYPNFWDIVAKSIFPEQLAKYNKQKQSDTAKK